MITFLLSLNFIRTHKYILQLARRSLWILVTSCYHHIKAERKIKPLWKQTIFLSVTLPESTRSMQKLVLAFYYLHKELTLIPATVLQCAFYLCLTCADLTFRKITLKTSVGRSDSKMKFSLWKRIWKSIFFLLCVTIASVKKVVSELRITTPVKE